MITPRRDDPLHWAHPLVHDWFINQIGQPSEPQCLGWPSILAGQSTLISAPTGSGKTFAAFLTCIDDLVKQALNGTLVNQTEILYISPLKAVSNDVQKNLLKPLHAIMALAKEQHQPMAEINVALRTGDTTPQERLAMLKKPPHILVTTPESFYILLTADKSRQMLKTVKTVIVDEIHAVANSKRGTHLSLSLERLEALTETSLLRIGLSATQKPINTIAQFLIGNNRPPPTLVDIGHAKQLDLAVEVPPSELSAVASNTQWDEIYDRIAQLARENRSTLIFANTRRMAERAAHHLAERLGADQVLAHHGSLSKKLRLAAENKLKNGELKALVATASLELGIDIGMVDLVCQLGSPRSIAIMLQRVGRAGHWHGAISKGRIFATTRDELIECAALVQAIYQGDLDQLIIPKQPLDVLAQQIVASCATNDWLEDDLFNLVKHSFPYQNLSRTCFDELLDMLSEGIAGSRGRYGAYLLRDRVNHVVKARRGSRLTAITSGGAIPDNGLFTVLAMPTNVMVGTLDEDFAVESHRGDIILLGSTSWKINRIESAAARVFVEDAHGAPPTVPFWRGEAPARTDELSLCVSNLRQLLHEQLPATCSATTPAQEQSCTLPAQQWLQAQCKVDQAGAQQVIDYLLQGRAMLGAVPSQNTIIAERFFDESGGMQLVIHAPFGGRINKAWGLALRKCFCRSFNFELQAAATEDGINICLTEQHSFPLADVFKFLHPARLKEILVQAILQSPLFATRWRWAAGRSLALVRFRNGKKVPPNILRMRAEDLLAAVFPEAAACQDNLGGKEIELPEHPLVDEAMKDCLTEALDIKGVTALITAITHQQINCLAVDTPAPSPFAHEILNANPYAYLDDAPLEERRARAVEMRRVLPPALLDNLGQLDAEVISQVQQQVWPDVRNADELHDVLQSFIAFPAVRASAEWPFYLDQLMAGGRAGLLTIKQTTLWFAAEKAQTVAAIYPEAVFNQHIQGIEKKPLPRDDGLVAMLRGWMLYLGPVTSHQLAQWSSLDVNEIEQVLLRIETTGLILRGSFTGQDLEWCERRLLARIHQQTLGKLRKEIAPVSAAQFVRWLLTWQHLAPGTQLSGEQGLLAVIDQLQGFEIPAKAWERDIFAKRVNYYDGHMLDRLCLMGVVGWGRFSPMTSMTENGVESKRIVPTSVAPITFFIRQDSQWLGAIESGDKNHINLSYAAQDVYTYLQQQGASFFNDIVHGVGHLKSEVERGLWELVTAGLATADGFDNLRALIDPKRRLIKKRRRAINPLYSSGRWSLLKTTPDGQGAIDSWCQLLLKRYGVVFRDLLARERNCPRWRELLIAFRRMEDRGEVRGGRFIDGFLGEQFALPQAVQFLRLMKSKDPEQNSITISAVDPLNVVGFILPGNRVTAIAGGTVILQNGQQLSNENS